MLDINGIYFKDSDASNSDIASNPLFRLRDIAMGPSKTYKAVPYTDIRTQRILGDLDPMSIVG